ncbi:MAG: hypothetical protein ACAH95_08560 [Fimbriimonas sp.]
MKDALQQKTVGCLMIAGIVVSVVSFGLMWVFSVAGVYRGTYTRTPVTNEITDAGPLNLVPLMLTFVVVGMLMFLGGLGYGFWVVKHEKEGPRQTIENFHVVARYAYDKAGYHLVDDGQIEFADRPRFYVRGVMPNGFSSEYEATEAVWRQSGEGMYGEAELQGKWLGRFTPYVGVPQSNS